MLDISTIGQVTSDSVIVQAVKRADKSTESISALIKQGRFDDVFDEIITWGITFAGKLLIALLIFFIGRWLIRKFLKFQRKIWAKRNMDETLRSFLDNLLSIAAYTALIILIINIVGAQTVSFAALVASAGLAIGLALKDNLANFAGGVMLLFNKPFKNGDFIEAQNLSGTVKAIGILYTTLTSADNKTIFIPNGPLSTGNIINYNTQITRRIDITVSVDYGSDVDKVKSILMDIMQKHAKILADPQPFARMIKMNDSSIDFSLRAWTKTADYWEVTYDLNEEIYNQLNAFGLNIPFPQMTVHIAKD